MNVDTVSNTLVLSSKKQDQKIHHSYSIGFNVHPRVSSPTKCCHVDSLRSDDDGDGGLVWYLPQVLVPVTSDAQRKLQLVHNSTFRINSTPKFYSIMAPLQSILGILALATAASTAFTSTAPILQRRTSLYQSGPDKGGGSAIATPATKQVTTTVTKQKQKSEQKQKAKPSEPDLRNEEDFEDAPMFRLFLIGDESYEQEHVVTRIFEIVEDCSEDEAARIFKSAYQSGEAFLGKYPKEIAETYAEQLTRSDPIIYADVRDDDDKTKKN